jgi:glycine/D-amino acid oxidase-like deaminating enzyme
MHIVIIGSGITGMTAALLLAREGHAVLLIEKVPATNRR